MHCSRLDHYRRITTQGKVGVCGHMIADKSFDNLNDLNTSEWLSNVKEDFKNNRWPKECIRCQEEEDLGLKSIRQDASDRHMLLSKLKDDYLIIGGILDNVCNSACQFCDETRSTKIGNLKFGKDYQIINNLSKFNELPQERIIELDINGGEPSNSKNYLHLLKNLPENLKIIRINTNASRYIKEIEHITSKNIKVIITISLDGIDDIFEYARWPLNWKNFDSVVDRYLELRSKTRMLSLDFWTTISAYTIGDFINIKNYAQSKNIDHKFGFLQEPSCLNVRYKNPLTLVGKDNLPNVAVDQDNSIELLEYLRYQDKIRKTNFENCYNWT